MDKFCPLCYDSVLKHQQEDFKYVHQENRGSL